jgi:cysteinyl-tRNA synthetase
MIWFWTRITPLLLICLLDTPAAAQEKGTTIQGRALEEVEIQIERGESGQLLDFRELLREFIQRISAYARSQNPNFVVVTKGSLELLTKIDIIDVKKVSSARTYMRSIDGILVDGLFFGERTVGVPTKPERLEKTLNYVRLAKKNNLNVMVMDYVADAQQAEQSYGFNEELELTPFVAGAKGEDLNSIPTFRKDPFMENSKSILSMIDAKNFLYLGNTSSFGRQDEFSLRIHDTNYDIIAVNIMHGRTPLSRQAAASHDYFWKPGWREGSPTWISGNTKDSPDRHFIQYWRPEWQNIIFGDTNSYIYGLIAQGFDGVILTGLEAYKYFLGDMEEEE